MDQLYATMLPQMKGKGTDALLFLPPFVQAQRIDEKITDVLRAIGMRTEIVAYDEGEPEVSYLDALVQQHQHQSYDLIIAIGGGSIIDLAKAYSLCVENSVSCTELLSKNSIRERKNHFICIPTTAGTGSEATSISIMKENGIKRAISASCFIPDTVVLDPIFLAQASFDVKFFPLVDAASHALESLLSNRSNEISEWYAVDALSRIIENEQYYLSTLQDKGDVANKIQIAAFHAGVAFEMTGVHVIHSFAYALCEQIPLRHGHAISIAFGPILEYLLSARGKEIPAFARYEYLIKRVAAFLDKHEAEIYDIPENIRNIQLLAERVLGNERLMKNSPMRFELQEMIHIAKMMYERIASKQK